MRASLLLGALAAAAMVAAPAEAAAQRQQAAQRDWTATVVLTPEGGYLMGNPEAELRIVEFVSLTCPHCRLFSQEGMPQLMPHVRSGRVSIELRNFVLNLPDLAAAMVSRCAAPGRYFGLTSAILAEQPAWTARVEGMPEAPAQNAGEALQALSRIASTAELDALARSHGVSVAEARACLSDEGRLQRIIEMRQAATALGVTGTPTFLVNGTLARGVHDWATLAPLIGAR